MRYAVFAIVALGCASPVPQNPETSPPGYLAGAVELIRLAPSPSITFHEGQCLEPTGHSGCLDGLMMPGCRIYLIDHFSLSAGSLVHELMHCFLEDEYGDLDPGHTRDEWGKVQTLNSELWEWERCIVWPDYYEDCER
jgi:hypothetical protein